MVNQSEFSSKIDLLCDAYEDDIRSGKRPPIEPILNQIDPPARASLLRELLALEAELLSDAEFQIRLPQHRAALPDYASLFDPTSLTVPGNGISKGFDSSASMPKRIGPYKILQRIGSGGMGHVYMAEQTRPVSRRVALKIIKSGLDSKQVVARFEAERQALAMMAHPSIARILDAGTTEEEQPWFAMELVNGLPLTEYCDRRKLSVPDRLIIFRQICDAVQHAHQKGIIHRDLKPSNILVTEYNGEPVPKVIDFGLAKALEATQRLTDKTMFTQFGQVMGTFRYMSPEQAGLDALDIDTRSDIYSLGVILYELLTGSTPLDEASLRQPALLKVLELVREHEPLRPSSRLTTEKATLKTVTEQRQIDSQHLSQMLSGDLDWIVMKAIDKDRNRRYETAADLARDVTHFLEDEPVLARPPSATYRIRKFVRKNRAMVATAAAITLLLIVAVIGTSIGFFRAEQARAAQNRLATDMLTRVGVDSLEKQQLSRAALCFAEAMQNATGAPIRKYWNYVRTQYLQMSLPIPRGGYLHTTGFKDFQFHPRNDALAWFQDKSDRWHVIDLNAAEDFLPNSDSAARSFERAAWSPTGNYLATVIGEEVVIHSVAERQPVQQRLWGPNLSVLRFLESDDQLLIGNLQTVWLWNWQEDTWSEAEWPGGEFSAIETLEADVEQRRLLVVGSSASDPKAATGRLLAFERPFQISLVTEFSCSWTRRGSLWRNRPTLAFDGKLVIYPGTNSLKAIDTQSGELKFNRRFQSTVQQFRCVDNQWLYVALGDQPDQLQMFEWSNWLDSSPPANGRSASLKHPHSIRDFHGHSGSLGVTAAWDGTTFLVAPRTKVDSGEFELRSTGIPRLGSIDVIRLNETAERVAILSETGLIHVWEWNPTQTTVTRLGFSEPDFPSPLIRSRIQLDGSQSLVATSGTTAISSGTNFRNAQLARPSLFEILDGSVSPLNIHSPTGGAVLDADISPAGDLVAVVVADQPKAERRRPRANELTGALHSLSRSTFQPLFEPISFESEPRAVVFSRDQKTIFVLLASGMLCFVDAQTGELAMELPVLADLQDNFYWFGNGELRLDPSGKYLAVGGAKTVRFVDLEQRQTIEFQLDHNEHIHDFRFSPERGLIATAGLDGRVIVADIFERRILQTITQVDYVLNARFNREGNRLVTAGRDRFARVWNWGSSKLVCPPMEHKDEVVDAMFIGESIVMTACLDQTVQFWESDTGLPLSDAIPLEQTPYRLEPTTLDRVIVSGAGDSAWIFDVKPLLDVSQPSDAETALRKSQAELVAGAIMVSNGQIQPLQPREWVDLWKAWSTPRPR